MIVRTCRCRRKRRYILHLCIVGRRVCIGAVVEIRPVATCCFVQAVKMEAVGHFLLGSLNLSKAQDNSEVTVKALTAVRDLVVFFLLMKVRAALFTYLTQSTIEFLSFISKE